MEPLEFTLGILLIDDDPAIIEQHEYMLGNRKFRRETPGRLYNMLKKYSIIETHDTVESILSQGNWPLKKDLLEVLKINPEIEDDLIIVEPDIANSASDAKKIWNELNLNLIDKRAVYIALIDYDMPVQSGLELAQEWNPDNGPVPVKIFYTGKAALLEEALESEGYGSALNDIPNHLAQAVIQKGASNDEFNELIWGVIEEEISDISTNKI